MTEIQKQNCIKICLAMNEKFIDCNDEIPQNRPIRLIDRDSSKQIDILYYTQAIGYDLVLESIDSDPMVCYAYDYKQELYEKFQKFLKKEELPSEKKEKRSNKILKVSINPSIQQNDLRVKINKAVNKLRKDKSNKIQLTIEGPADTIQKARNTLLSFQQISSSLQIVPEDKPFAVTVDEFRKQQQEEIDLDSLYEDNEIENIKNQRGNISIKQNFVLQGVQEKKFDEETMELELDLKMMKKVDAFLKKRKDQKETIYIDIEQVQQQQSQKLGMGKINYEYLIQQQVLRYQQQQEQSEKYNLYSSLTSGDFELAKFRVRNYPHIDTNDEDQVLQEIQKKSKIEKVKKKEIKLRPTKESIEEERINSIVFKPQKLSNAFQKGKRKVDQNLKDDDSKDDILQYFDKQGSIYKQMKTYFMKNNIKLDNKNILQYIKIKTSKSLDELNQIDFKNLID